MSKFESVLNNLKLRKQRAENGLYNCIPLAFPRFRAALPGTEMAKFIVITANQKIGKSKLSDYMYVYEPLFFMMEHPELKVKTQYFTLEVSPMEKYNEFLCHLLYRLDGIEIDTKKLKSVDKDNPVDSKIFELLESERYRPYIEKFEEMVEYIGDIKNPTGVNKKCREYALNNGHLNFRTITVKDELGIESKRQILDEMNPYTPDDPEEYRIIIIDNANNLARESGMSKMETIEKMAKYGITLRDQLKYIFILIQHQAQAQEGIENQKLNRLKPSSDGLADCKTTTRDANLVIGLYSPFKYGIREYEGYNIEKLRDNVRFMEVIEDRDYGANGQICPLYFDGAVSTFAELPRVQDKEEMDKMYKFVMDRQKRRLSKSFLMHSIRKLINWVRDKK